MKKSDWKKIRNEYENTDISISDLAKAHGIKANTVTTHKRRNKWAKKKNVTTHVTKNVTNQKMSRDNVTKLDAVDDISDSGLNEKQKLFCMLYLKTHNGTKSYQEAYGCSYNAARANAYLLLTKTAVKKLLKKLHERQSADLYLNANDILKEYARQAFADIGDYVRFGHKKAYDENGDEYEQTYMYLDNSAQIDTTLLKDVSVGGSSGKHIQMYDKQKAMKILLDNLPKADTNKNKKLPLFDDILKHMAEQNKNDDNEK